MMRVPFAETVIRPLVGGMIEVVSARVNCQLVQEIQIEMGFDTNCPRRRFKNLQCALEKIVIFAATHADAAQENGNRSDALVSVDFTLALVFKDGDGAMADVIVELLERAGHDARGLLPRSALAQ